MSLESLEPVSPLNFNVPIHGAWLDSRVPAIAQWLQAQDPTLTLVARASHLTGQVEEYDLYSGPHWLASWSPHEVHLIKSDFLLMKARVDRPSTHESLAKAMKRSADKRVRDAKSRAHDAYVEAMEHFAWLVHDTTEPRNIFRGMDGFRDKEKDSGQEEASTATNSSSSS